MRTYLLFLVFSFILEQNLYSQDQNFSIGFEKEKMSVTKEKNERYYQIKIQSENTLTDSLVKVVVRINQKKTTLPLTDFEIDFSPITLMKGAGPKTFNFYLHLTKDSLPDRDREIVLNLVVLDTNNTEIKELSSSEKNRLTILVTGIKPANDSLEGYNYLAYIGTNFDLVDGPKAKNIFFATNFMIPCESYKLFHSGIYISLYGNRTNTSTEVNKGVIRTSKFSPYSDSSSISHRVKSDLEYSFVSDNLGAYFSPLLNIGKVSGKDKKIQMYLAPSFEFIWRRTTQQYIYTNNIPEDSSINSFPVSSEFVFPDNITINTNQYQFNVGIGTFIKHEVGNYSLRLYWALSHGTTYLPAEYSSSNTDNSQYQKSDPDLTFSGRFWVTHGPSGITFQAEIMNAFKKPYPFFGATISKAINFNKVGKLFDPVNK